MQPRTVNAAATQLPFAWASSPQEYFDRMRTPIAQAAAMGAELIVLPQYVGDMLVGVQVPSEPTASRSEIATRGGFSDWNACVRHTALTTAQFYVHTFETLADRYNVYLAPGTISLPGDERAVSGNGDSAVYHASFLFGPNGDVLGEQRQLYPSGDGDFTTGFGSTLAPIETALGRVGLIIGDDALHLEVRRSAITRGCRLLLNPIGRLITTKADQMDGLWEPWLPEGLFVIQSALAGGGYAGRAAIYGRPKHGRGVGDIPAAGSTDQQMDVVCAEIEIN